MRHFRRHDDITIKMWFGRTPKAQLAKQLRCTEDELTARAAVLGLKDKAGRQDQQAAAKPACAAKPEPAPKPPKVTPKSTRSKTNARVWTEEEDHALSVDYSDMDNDALAVKYGRSKSSIVQRAGRLGLRKSPEFISRLARSRQRGKREQLLMSLRSARAALDRGNTARASEHIDRALEVTGAVA